MTPSAHLIVVILRQDLSGLLVGLRLSLYADTGFFNVLICVSGHEIDYQNSSSSTRDGLALATFWMDKCSMEHKNCHLNKSTFLPTRLVDLTGEQARLQLADSMNPNSKYASLSQCWGEIRSRVVLTEAPLSQFLLALPSDAVLNTYRDAFEVAKRLGLSYVWIDSLCIIQDSTEEWKRESTLMRDVYG